MIIGSLYGEKVSYLNVYAPPICPADFHTKVFSLFADWIMESSVIGGDFNSYLNPCLDKSHTGSQSPWGVNHTLLGCCRDFSFIDTWKTLHPTDRQYTFYSKVHKSSSRIDYFFTPEHAQSFQNFLVDPLLKMCQNGQNQINTFDSGHLPNTMMETNISLVLKKLRPPEESSLYRTIALLDVDRKIIAKILEKIKAKRLERSLPDLISVAQTGFILGRNFCNNVQFPLFCLRSP